MLHKLPRCGSNARTRFRRAFPGPLGYEVLNSAPNNSPFAIAYFTPSIQLIGRITWLAALCIKLTMAQAYTFIALYGSTVAAYVIRPVMAIFMAFYRYCTRAQHLCYVPNASGLAHAMPIHFLAVITFKT